MAITNIRGTVNRVFYNGKGAEVVETFTAGGKEISKRWACWFQEPHGLGEGEVVEVSGLHSDEVDEWTDKEQQTRHSVKRSLNKARIRTGDGAGGSQGGVNAQNHPTPTQSNPSPQNDAEPWATGPTDEWLPEGSTPF
jgi:hypothetical protein